MSGVEALTTDLVTTLRAHADEFDACYGPDEAALLQAAASEIERLRARIETLIRENGVMAEGYLARLGLDPADIDSIMEKASSR